MIPQWSLIKFLSLGKSGKKISEKFLPGYFTGNGP
jgi:hypothetical protein